MTREEWWDWMKERFVPSSPRLFTEEEIGKQPMTKPTGIIFSLKPAYGEEK